MRNLAVLLVLAVSATPSEKTSTNVAKGWVLDGPGAAYSFHVDMAEKHGGRASGLIECTTPDVDDFGVLTQLIKADAYRGRRVRLSSYLRTRGIEDGSARMWMRVDGPEVSPMAMDNMAKRAIHGDTEWARYDIVLDLPADAVRIAFGVILGGQGRLWVDDLAFDFVDGKVASTDMHVPPDPFKTVVPADLPGRPINPGFED